MIRPWRLEAINPRAPCFSRARRTTQVTDSRAQTSQATAATDSSVVLFMPGPPQRLRRSRDGMAKWFHKKLLARTKPVAVLDYYNCSTSTIIIQNKKYSLQR